MKKMLFLGVLLLFGNMAVSQPEWYERPPKASGFYYFSGIGKGLSARAAKEAALADIFSQIVYMVSASVTSNSSFEKYVEENGADAKKSSAVYSKVRAKGEAVIEQFEIEEQSAAKEEQEGKKYEVLYLLAKIPMSEIAKARERAEKEKQERLAAPMAVFALALFPDKRVETVDSIQGELENLYKSMGFSVKTVDVEFAPDALRTTGRAVSFLKSQVGGEIKKALLCVIMPSNIRKENKLGKFPITSVLGEIIIREIDLETGKIISTNQITGKGISMRKGDDAPEDAFRKLIKSLTESLLGDEGAAGKKEEYF